jgi:hypothetical protein
MTNRSTLLDHWSEVRERLPKSFDLEARARASGAFQRARGVRSAADLLWLALAYAACGMSLREACAWAEVAGIASLSGPSLLERLVKARRWLGELVGAVIAERAEMPARRWAGYRLRALDGTSICHPGADRTSWRLHVGYDLATGEVDQLELTDGHGAESLQRLAYRPGEIVLADRYYAKPRDLRPVIAAGADLVVRTGWNSLRLLHPDGSPFDLFATLAAQSEEEGEVRVRIHEGEPQAEPLILRLLIRRKEPRHAEAEQKRLLKEAKKRGREPDPRSLEAAKYVLLLTSLPRGTFAASDLLALYRFRWQIELAFKRMKSLAGLKALPAKNPDLARSWIYAKLLAFLIAERIAGQVPDSPPCGSGNPCGPGKAGSQPVTVAPHQNGLGQHSRRHPGPLALAARSSRSPTTAPLLP